MIRRTLYITLFTLMALSLTACVDMSDSKTAEGSSDGNVIERPFIVDATIEETFQPSHLYVDFTPSMQGFAKVPNSFYKQSLDIASNVLELSGTPVNYYEYGIKTIKIKDRQSFLKLTKSDSYQYAKENQHNNTAALLKSAQLDGFQVIVTDLFENEYDIRAFTQTLIKNHLNKGKTVGVLTMSSPFDGIVYDVGEQKAQFKYKSGNAPQKYRPYYFIVVGYEKQVESFIEGMDEQIKALDDQIKIDGLIFSPNVFSENSTHYKLTSKQLKEMKTIVKDKEALAFYLRDQASASDMQYEILYKLKPFRDWFKPKFTVELTAFSGNENQMSEVQDSFLTPEVESDEILDHFLITLKSKEASIESGLYKFSLKVMGQEGCYSIPKWVEERTLPLDQIEKWKKSPQTFEGNKTANLSIFITELAMNTIKEERLSQISFALDEFYIKVK